MSYCLMPQATFRALTLTIRDVIRQRSQRQLAPPIQLSRIFPPRTAVGYSTPPYRDLFV